MILGNFLVFTLCGKIRSSMQRSRSFQKTQIIFSHQNTEYGISNNIYPPEYTIQNMEYRMYQNILACRGDIYYQGIQILHVLYLPITPKNYHFMRPLVRMQYLSPGLTSKELKIGFRDDVLLRTTSFSLLLLFRLLGYTRKLSILKR